MESWHRDPALRETAARFARHRLEGREDQVGSLEAFTSRQPFIIDSRALQFAVQTLRSQPAIDAILELGLHAVAVFPLLADTGEVIGLVTLARCDGREAFSEAEVAAAVDLCRRAGTALENARSYGREREMSEQLQRAMLTAPVQPPTSRWWSATARPPTRPRSGATGTTRSSRPTE